MAAQPAQPKLQQKPRATLKPKECLVFVRVVELSEIVVTNYVEKKTEKKSINEFKEVEST